MDIAVFTCVHVLEQGAPILFISHDPDGAQQLLCGAEAHSVRDARIIGLREAFALDPSVVEIYELPLDHMPERDRIGARWRRGPTPPDEGS